MKFVFSFLILIASSIAFAGADTVGDGGAGVICKGYVRLLDLYEFENLYNIKSRVVGPEETLDVGVYNLTLRLEPLIPAESRLIISHLVDWVASTRFVNPIKSRSPAHTKDNEPIVPLPADCRLGQLAFLSRYEGRIYYDEKAWRRMPGDDRAALLFHEALHFVFPHGPTNDLRWLVGYLAAPNDFRKAHLQEAKELLLRNLPYQH